MCELSPVTFHGDTIFCIDHHGEPFTPMKPIVSNMGLDWAGQFSKLRANASRWGIENISIPTESGIQEMVSMPVRKLPAYLNSINPNKVKPKLRPRIVLYQDESDNVLWDYWTKGRAERQTATTSQPMSELPITPDQQCTLQTLVKSRIEAIPAERRPKGAYPQVWSRFNNHFRLGSYKQLPQARMSEAIEYLMNMTIAQQELPTGDTNTLSQVSDNAFNIPDNTQQAKDFNKILNDVNVLAHKIGQTMLEVGVVANAGGRSSLLPPALNARYNTLDQMHKAAMASLYTAEHMLYCMYYMGKEAKFA